MAKVVGKDVLLDLMDEVKRLGDTQRRHEQSLQRVTTRMDVVVEHSRALGHRFEETAKQVSSLSQRMGAVTQQMNSVTQQMHTLSEQFGGVVGHVSGFSGELTSLRADLTEVIGVQAEFGGGLKRLSAILLKALGANEDRFDELEERLTRLEKKSA